MKLKVLKEHIAKVFSIFGKSRTYISLLFLSFLTLAALDLIGISLIGPFVLIFFDFDRVQTEWGLFVGYDQTELAIYSSILIIIVFILRSISIWAVNAFILNVAFDRQVELRGELIIRMLDQDYSTRLTKSTAHYTTTLFAFCQQFVQSLLNICRISAEGLSVIFIIGLLMFTDIKLFFSALVFCSIAISAMLFFFSRKFKEYGEEKNKGLIKFSTAVHESVYGIKEIKILGLSSFFHSNVVEGATKAAAAEKRLYLFSIVPRYLVETLLVAVICLILLVSIFSNNDVIETISVLSIFLVAALRLLPSISMIVSAFNALSLDIDSIKKLYEELNIKPQLQRQSENFNQHEFKEFSHIEFKDISFQYDKDKKIFENLNLQIKKGDFIGLVGESGEGKTTLVDLILAINLPQSGDIIVDEKSIYNNLDAWRATIAYLPQEIFLINGTVAENVALGTTLENINFEKVERCIERAGLSSVINDLPDGLKTQIGERGLKFSGGQRQRIAIARAFFSDRNIFILDESTSALDQSSADKILDQILQISKTGSTVILISHNEEMLSNCNRKLRISNGKISEI